MDQSWPRPPDLRRQRKPISENGARLWHRIARSRAGLRAIRFQRRAGVLSCHGVRCELRLCQPAAPGTPDPAELSRGILICAGSMSGLAEEAPLAYKDVSRVVEVVHKLGIGRKIARLEPVAVIKG